MNEKKSKINPWLPVVVMGVVTILFAMYAVQSQTDFQAVQKEMSQLKDQLNGCTNASMKLQKDAEAFAKLMEAENAAARKAAEDCKQSKKRK